MDSRVAIIEKDCLLCKKPTTVLLSLTSEIAAVYPLILRFSMFLYRLVQ